MNRAYLTLNSASLPSSKSCEREQIKECEKKAQRTDISKKVRVLETLDYILVK
jgi:hypothetical protein